MASDTRNMTPADPEGPTSPPPQLPDGWLAQWEGSSRKYYFVQRATGYSQWEVPTQPAPSVPTPTATPQSTQLYTPPPDGMAGGEEYAGAERGWFSNKPAASAMPNQGMSVPGQQNTAQFQQQGHPQQHGSSLSNVASNILGRMADRLLDGRPGSQQAYGQMQGGHGAQGVQGTQQIPGQHSQQHHEGMLPSLPHGLFSHDQRPQQNFGYSNSAVATGYTGTAPPATYQTPGQPSPSPQPGQLHGQVPGQVVNQFGQSVPQGAGIPQQFGTDAHGALSSQFSMTGQTPPVGQNVQPGIGQTAGTYGPGLNGQPPSYPTPQPQWQQSTPGMHDQAQSHPQMGYGQPGMQPHPQHGQFQQMTPGMTPQNPQFGSPVPNHFGQPNPSMSAHSMGPNQQFSSPPGQFGHSPPQQQFPHQGTPFNQQAPGPQGPGPYGQQHPNQGFPSDPNLAQQQQHFGQPNQPQFPGSQQMPGSSTQPTPSPHPPMSQFSPPAQGSPFQQNQQQPPMGQPPMGINPSQGGMQSPHQQNPNFMQNPQQRPGMPPQNPSQQNINAGNPQQQQLNQQRPGMPPQHPSQQNVHTSMGMGNHQRPGGPGGPGGQSQQMPMNNMGTQRPPQQGMGYGPGGPGGPGMQNQGPKPQGMQGTGGPGPGPGPGPRPQGR